MLSWQQALQRLQEGNLRFAAGDAGFDGAGSHERRRELVTGQNPFAIVLGCSDSRVPAELVFDQGIGDLFVIRIAGNIVAPSQIGSVEFAAESFSTPLVVVLGHTQCGAVKATLSEIVRPTEQRSPNLRAIVERIRPALESLVHTELSRDPDALMHQAIRSNVRASVNQLRHGSEILERLCAQGGLRIIGAEYSLESGVVDFLDDVS
ncbi:carbonic anhydrase [Panacagrimonas sp.]|uniref:carbonic anhydrase n=1 Tax=Panacagrimonas sp. TaxID=2480088 RepID=UPI003B522FF2